MKIVFRSGIPESSSKLMTSFISCVLNMISSNTGTLPPTRPVLPPCGQTAKPCSLQYFKICDTSAVVLGFNKTLLSPETIYNDIQCTIYITFLWV